MTIRRPGAGPRSAVQLYEATLSLLAEHGYDGLTIEGVAAATGVNKTTIYRWWDSKDELLVDALINSVDFDLVVPDTGNVRDNLIGLVGQVRGLLTSRATAPTVASAFAAAAARPALAALVRRFFADRLKRERTVLTRAVTRGEVDDEVDPQTVMDLLLGALWLRVMFRDEPVGPDFDERVVDMVLYGIARPSPPERLLWRP